MTFNHFDEAGRAIMVDVSSKEPTMRTAIAEATLILKPETIKAVSEGVSTKGDVIGIARLAGISAAKKTSELIPLSHPLAIHNVAIEFETCQPEGRIRIISKVKAFERTGVEMEAMTAASVAALTVYDMCKGSDKGIRIKGIRLLFKEGGKSGKWEAP